MTLVEVHSLLADRDPDPIAFSPATPPLPWGEGDFSRRFFECHTRGEVASHQEAQLLWETLSLKAGQRVLDLGCGGGRTLSILAEAGVGGAGIDIGPYPIQVAKEALAGKDIACHLGDMRQALPEGPFDAAYCIFGQLTCFPEAEAVGILKKVRESLKPGGKLFLEFYLGPQLLLVMDGLQEWMVKDEWLGGRYPQLILDEHIVNWQRATYVRRSYVIALEGGGPHLESFVQCSEIYDAPRVESLLAQAGFEVEALMGDWDGEPFEEDLSMNLLVLAGQSGPRK